jgi:hypothetical protein
MKLIHQIKTYFFQKGLNHRQLLQGQSSKVKPFSKIQSIGFVFEANNHSSTKTAVNANKSLSKEGKKVSLLGFFKGSQEEVVNFNFPFFTEKDLDWCGRPLKGEAASFAMKNYDLLINLTLEFNPQLEFILATTKADFKAGSNAGSVDHYDLMVDVSENPQSAVLLEKIFSLLKNTIQ